MEFEQPDSTCNIQTFEHPLKNLESMLSRKSKSFFKNKSIAPVVKQISKPEVVETKKVTTLTLQERYKIAWKMVYKELSKLRQKEIDESQKSDTFGSSQRDKDFVRQVAQLAESDKPLEI